MIPRSKKLQSRLNTQSILDGDEIEAPGRRRLSRLGARAAGEQRCERARAELDRRADERPHHVAEERVGRDLEVDVVAAPDPLGALHRANEGLVARSGRGERAEVVLAANRCRAVVQLLHVERVRQPPRAAAFERRRRAPVEDPVAVAARARREPRAEVVGNELRRHDRDLVRESRVEGLRRPLRRRPALDVHRDDVAERVDARVGSAGHGEPLDARERLRESVGEGAFDRREAGLRRPAPEGRAVVLDR